MAIRKKGTVSHICNESWMTELIAFNKSAGAMRVCGVLSLITFILAGQLISIWQHKEYWPFSPYAMYSGIGRRNIKRYVLVGQTMHGERIVYPSKVGYFLSGRTLTGSADAIVIRPIIQAITKHKRPDRAEKCLAYLFDLYFRNRRSTKSEWTAINALLLYQYEWDLELMMEDFDKPQARRLLAAYVAI